MPTNNAPPVMLGPKPRVDSLETLDQALQELAWIAAREKEIKAACEQRVRLCKHQAAEQMVVEIGRKTLTFAERRAALEEAVFAFCEENREVVLADSGKKTREFTHGKVSWRKEPLRLQFVEGKAEADVMAAADKKSELADGILGSLVKRLGRLRLTENIRASMLFNIKLTLNRSALLAAYKNGEITDKDLKALCLEAVEPEEEVVTLKLHDYVVQTEDGKAA